MPRRHLKKPLTLGEIATVVGGELHGDEHTPISALCPLDTPVAGGLSFTRSKTALQLNRALTDSPIAGVLVPAGIDNGAVTSPIPRIAVADPVYALTQLVPLFFEPPEGPSAVHPRAEIDPSARLGKNVRIGAYCVVGPRVVLGDDVVLHPHVVLYPGVEIGPRTIIHAGAIVREECRIGGDAVVQNGAIIGADGFGYIPRPGVGLVPVPQVGTVVLADRVDIGANACVDRATLGETRIGLGTKIDNLVQIGHNTVVGSHSILCGQSGVAGSSVIGDQVVLGGNVGVADHMTIAHGVRVAAKAGVSTDLPTKGDYAGHPAVPVRQWNRAMAALLKLGGRKKSAD